MNQQLHRIQTITHLTELYFAGGGEFVFKSIATDKYFNIKMKRVFGFIDQNKASYISVCFIDPTVTSKRFIRLGKWYRTVNAFQKNSYSVNNEKHFTYLLGCFSFITNSIVRGTNLFEKYEIYYTGNCCRCGQPLTTAESVATGLGTDCKIKLTKEVDTKQFQLF